MENLPEMIERLIEAVSEMRHRQREYFRTRSKSSLEAAQAAERKVDRLLEELQRPSLFEISGRYGDGKRQDPTDCGM